MDEPGSRALLRNLELLRAEFVDRYRIPERKRLEITVYAFGTDREFRAYRPESMGKHSRIDGFYHEDPDRAVILLAPSEGRDEARRLIFHEYVHHLFAAAEQDPPTWYNEGMAELLAGIRVENDHLEIGHPVPGRLFALQREKLLSLETLFAVGRNSPIYRSNDHTGLFYAESWALLHYWYFGNSKLSRDAIDRFVQVASSSDHIDGVRLHAWFRECFGMEYTHMLRGLDHTSIPAATVSAGSRSRQSRQPIPIPGKRYLPNACRCGWRS